ncbi:hypothetical protein ACU686_35020 [Yinghuangia aomiensis]
MPYGAKPMGEVRYVGVWLEGLLRPDDEGFYFDADLGRPLYWQAAEGAVAARLARLLGRTPQAPQVWVRPAGGSAGPFVYRLVDRSACGVGGLAPAGAVLDRLV